MSPLESLGWFCSWTLPRMQQHPPEQHGCHPHNSCGGALPELSHLHGYKQPAYICSQILPMFIQNQLVLNHSQISTDYDSNKLLPFILYASL